MPPHSHPSQADFSFQVPHGNTHYQTQTQYTHGHPPPPPPVNLYRPPPPPQYPPQPQTQNPYRPSPPQQNSSSGNVPYSSGGSVSSPSEGFYPSPGGGTNYTLSPPPPNGIGSGNGNDGFGYPQYNRSQIPIGGGFQHQQPQPLPQNPMYGQPPAMNGGDSRPQYQAAAPPLGLGLGGFSQTSNTSSGTTATQSHINGHSSSAAPPSKKRAKQAVEEEVDSEDEAEAPKRTGGACQRCKLLKVKCEFPLDAEACKKCMSTGNECYIPGRKKRRPPAKRDELMKQIRLKDSLISQLLEQLEARSSILAGLSLPAPSGGSPHDATTTDPIAQAALKASEEKRERELSEWVKRAKETIMMSREGSSLLGGEANPLIEGGEQDSDEEGTEEEVEDGIEGSVLASTSKEEKVTGSALPSAAPYGFLEKMARSGSGRRLSHGSHSSGGSGEKSEEEAGEGSVGIAGAGFFEPLVKPTIKLEEDGFQLPQILVRGVVTPKDVGELFGTYLECMNLSTCLLDEKLYTPERTLYRSPFLFTVICAIASRYHPNCKDLYPILMNHARLAAGTALISGRKSLETCQAYILMAQYPIPARRWSEDRSWMFLGCAIRMATDLNLHHPPVLSEGRTATTIDTIMEREGQAREILNRTRAWLSCFNIDKATATQFGKPTTLREDWMFPLLQRNMEMGGAEWWCPSPFATKYDIHLCAYSALLREIAAFHETIYSDPSNPSGLNESIEFEKLTYEFDDKIEQLGEQWFHRVDENMDTSDPQCVFRKGLLKLEFYYNQLVALSFGFQHAFRRGAVQKDNMLLLRCYKAATRVVSIVVDELASQRYLTYCPESHFVFATFASAFLLKLLRPKFSTHLEAHHQSEILEIVERVVKTLSDVAMDDRHAPKLYSKFISGLLKKGQKILARGTASVSSVSSMGSPASMHDRDVPAPAVPPKQDVQGGAGVPYDMQGVTNSLPSNEWLYGVSSPGENDTLAPMQFFDDQQFWDEGLLPGFSWTATGPTPAGENIIADPGYLDDQLRMAHALPTFPNMGSAMSMGTWN